MAFSSAEVEELRCLLSKQGPMTGAEIVAALGGDPLQVWRACRQQEDFCWRLAGKRYLRLDRRVDGFARLSPSIWREFLSYKVIGKCWQVSEVEKKASEINFHAEKISHNKAELAYSVISALGIRMEGLWGGAFPGCVLLAGDIVYNMAHDIPRPESSTGKLVQGSDIDLIVVLRSGVPGEQLREFDEALFREKRRLLMAPHLRQEIDYVVKTMDRVRRQLAFDTFKNMVACKILQEAAFLWGSEELFTEIKASLRAGGISARLKALEKPAAAHRLEAEERLLTAVSDAQRDELLSLFFPAEEAEEFE